MTTAGSRGAPLALPIYPVGDLGKPTLVDLALPRPFERWHVAPMEAAIGGWLSESPPRLELATLALVEIERRGNESLRARMRFARYGLEPIPWLPAAHAKVRETFTPAVLASQKTGRLGAHVYVVLRGGYTASSGFYGAYVGSTGRTVAARIAEHRRGGRRAARGLPRHGIEPLWSLFDFINPVPRTKAGREEWETRLHEALAPVVPRVTGDVAF